MRSLVASIIALVAMGSVVGVATAQKGLSTGPNMDAIENARRIEENAMRALDKPRKAGLAALQAQDYTQAEKSFTELLSKDPTTSDANYLMGLAKLGLKKWPEAKQHLELAIISEPARPEPKARLGVADIMVNDMTGAMAQRAELVSMTNKCANTCADARRIADNLAMIDKVLAVTKPAQPAEPAKPPSSTPLPEG
jgi:tetratricopeptide (TPR) repeat protein